MSHSERPEPLEEDLIVIQMQGPQEKKGRTSRKTFLEMDESTFQWVGRKWGDENVGVWLPDHLSRTMLSIQVDAAGDERKILFRCNQFALQAKVFRENQLIQKTVICKGETIAARNGETVEIESEGGYLWARFKLFTPYLAP